MNKEFFQNNYNVLINNILQSIEQNDHTSFRKYLNNNSYLINKQNLNYLFNYCNKDNIFRPNFISILINFGLDPNTTLGEPYKYKTLKNKNNMDLSNNNNRIGKSILMIACEKSNLSLIQELCEQNNKNQKPLNVNYYDKNGRNALFYLRGGNDDKQIIKILIRKGIDINSRDKEENTPLHYLILNTNNVKLIIDLIEEGGANFMIKNKLGKTGLDLINEKYIQRVNCDNLINDFEYIKPLLKLIKKHLSIKLYPSNKFSQNSSEVETNNSNNNMRLNNKNIIKLSSLSNASTISNSDINNESYQNVFVKFNPLSLIVNTQFNDNDNTSSTSEKIEYYTQMNQNKSYLLSQLKQSKDNIKQMTKLIEQKIKEKKERIELLQNNLNEKKSEFKEKSINFAKNFDKLKNGLNKVRNEVKEKRQSLLEEKSNSLFDIKQNPNFLYKYLYMINTDFKIENIYKLLQIDLIDYMTYVHKKTKTLEPIIQKLYNIIQQSVKDCLGEKYHLKMYGSRATKLCLPWSDIDYVISCEDTMLFEPLNILNNYLYTINDKFYEYMKYISSATIPVLKIFSKKEYEKISLDISLENPEHHGEECVNYIKKKIIEYEVLTPLTFALKTILQKAFLNDPYTGGLTSYGVILLIIHFLNVQQRKGNDISMKSLGKLFYDILYYYGNEYDITNPIIIGENDIKKIISIHQLQLYKNEFILVDPLNISNNVARNTRQYQNIKLAFKIGCVSIIKSCGCGCHYQYNGINVKEEGCEHNLLNRIFNDIKRNTP